MKKTKNCQQSKPIQCPWHTVKRSARRCPAQEAFRIRGDPCTQSRWYNTRPKLYLHRLYTEHFRQSAEGLC